MDVLGVNDGRYQVVEEDRILQVLLLYCWPTETRLGDWKQALSQARQTLARWRAQGLPSREDGGRRYFDIAQVLNFMAWTSAVNGDSAYEQRAVPAARRRIVAPLLPAQGTTQPTGIFAPARFEVTLRREFNLKGIPAGSAVRLRLPLPFADRTQGEISVELVEPPEAPCRTLPGVLEVRVAVPGGCPLVAVAVRITFTSFWQSFEVDASRLQPWDTTSAEYQLYTRHSEGLIQVTPLLARLVDSLAGPARNPWQAIQAFWDFFFERLRLGAVHYDALDPADPLGSLVQRGWFDCLTGSALLVGLCRARGIPARVVSGYNLEPLSPGHHYWAEVLLPPWGWLPLDLASWGLAGGRRSEESWSRFFLGQLDYRMKTQCLPHIFTGNPGVRLPAAWYLVAFFAGEGVEHSFHDLATRLLYREQVQVDAVSAQASWGVSPLRVLPHRADAPARPGAVERGSA